jgi:hypothetical protein
MASEKIAGNSQGSRSHLCRPPNPLHPLLPAANSDLAAGRQLPPTAPPGRGQGRSTTTIWTTKNGEVHMHISTPKKGLLNLQYTLQKVNLAGSTKPAIWNRAGTT